MSYGSRPPGVGTDHGNLPRRQVIADRRADSGLARSELGVIGSAFLRESRIVFPQDAPAGAKEDDIPLASIFDALCVEGGSIVFHGDGVGFFEPVDTLQGGDVDENAAGEKTDFSDVLGAHLLQTSGPADVFQPITIYRSSSRPPSPLPPRRESWDGRGRPTGCRPGRFRR